MNNAGSSTHGSDGRPSFSNSDYSDSHSESYLAAPSHNASSATAAVANPRYYNGTSPALPSLPNSASTPSFKDINSYFDEKPIQRLATSPLSGKNTATVEHHPHTSIDTNTIPSTQSNSTISTSHFDSAPAPLAQSQIIYDRQESGPSFNPSALSDGANIPDASQDATTLTSNSILNGSDAAFTEPDTVPVGFDDGVLRALCDLDCGTPLLGERIKQGIASCREASMFLKKRAVIEEEYARSMMKLTRTSKEAYSISEGKAGSYVTSWLTLLRAHEYLGDNRLKFATQLSEMSEELTTLTKEVEKSRKASREMGSRLEKGLSEQDSFVDKLRQRLDSATEDLERVLISKQGDATVREDSSTGSQYNPASNSSKATTNRSFGKAISKLKGPKTLAQVAKQEEECRSRVGQCTDAYRSLLVGAQSIRREYFNSQLPRILRSLKESVDECDLGTQYHLSRYAFLFESVLVNDGMTISPVSMEDGPGLKSIVESMDNREDFKTFMSQYALSWQMSGQRGPRREGLSEEVALATPRLPSQSPRIEMSSTIPTASLSQPTFGVDLGDQMMRDNVEVPRVLVKCCEVIESQGIDSMGIYRLSGTTSKVQRLKGYLDRDVEAVDLYSEENLSDINNTAAVLKLWLRELPEPLLTWELYYGFVEAAKIENDRLRHIRLHERVNDLPDPNYATLKFLMGHLDKVRKLEHLNQMSCSNLAIVFGPNLLGPPPQSSLPAGAPNSNYTQLADTALQCKCVETILEHFEEIFVDAEG